MHPKKKKHPKEKSKLHPRNKNRERYDFKLLIDKNPELAQFVKLNVYKDESIDFANPKAVKALNAALLKSYYNIDFWDIPENYLCPPIPGRADYIHHIADLLCSYNYGKIPVGNTIKCLDIGVGANCIYPIIGNIEYGWLFIASDIDETAIKSANKIVELNHKLNGKVECRLQTNKNDFFYGIVRKDEPVDLTICNPPFHTSAEEANASTLRKQRNLKKEKVTKSNLNFGGQNNELWCVGGEKRFVANMIKESKKFAKSCFWFSTLISKQAHLKAVYHALNEVNATKVETISMGQGNKISRIVAWTFLSKEEQKNWKNRRWNQVEK